MYKKEDSGRRLFFTGESSATGHRLPRLDLLRLHGLVRALLRPNQQLATTQFFEEVLLKDHCSPPKVANEVFKFLPSVQIVAATG